MVAGVIALVVYLAVVFGSEEPRYGVFTSLEKCQEAVQQVRETGVFVTDCVKVVLPAPKVAPSKGA